MELWVLMLKLIGSLFVILACTGGGFLIAQGYSNRTKEIRQLQNIITYIETEIIYGQTPLITIMTNISEREQGQLAKIFANIAESMQKNEGTFAEAWQTAFEQMVSDTSLKASEVQVMQQLGKIMGRSDRANQQKYLRVALSHLQTEEQDAHELQKKYEKLSRTLGILTGILIVLLLF